MLYYSIAAAIANTILPDYDVIPVHLFFFLPTIGSSLACFLIFTFPFGDMVSSLGKNLSTEKEIYILVERQSP